MCGHAQGRCPDTCGCSCARPGGAETTGGTKKRLLDPTPSKPTGPLKKILDTKVAVGIEETVGVAGEGGKGEEEKGGAGARQQRAFVRLCLSLQAGACFLPMPGSLCEESAHKEANQSAESDTSECAITVAQSSHPCAPAQDRWHWPAGMGGFASKAHHRSESDQPSTVSIYLGSCVCLLGGERPYLPGRRLYSGCGW